MKLNKQGKDELRLIIEKQLINVPQGQRIHLDNELLEELLFETIVYHKESGKILKLPVWSGDFLSKIDLSEISFEDVAWSLLEEKDNEPSIWRIKEKIDVDVYDMLLKQIYYLDNDKMVNYSNTNAKIDFNKSWDKKVKGFIVLKMCNFSGTDLSNNLLNEILAYDCDLSYTKIPFNPDKVQSVGMERVFRTNLSGLDLRNVYYELDDFVYEMYHLHPTCNFSNTGLHIVDKNLTETIISEPAIKEDLSSALIEGRLIGCYINNKLITSTEQSQIVKQEKKSEYEQMKSDLFAAVTQSIEEQKKSFKK